MRKAYSSSTNKAKIYSYCIFVQQMYWLQDKLYIPDDCPPYMAYIVDVYIVNVLFIRKVWWYQAVNQYKNNKTEQKSLITKTLHRQFKIGQHKYAKLRGRMYSGRANSTSSTSDIGRVIDVENPISHMQWQVTSEERRTGLLLWQTYPWSSLTHIIRHG